MWIKKENIYHKPFYKQKLKMTMLVVLITGMVFLAYQIGYMNQLDMSTLPHRIRGQLLKNGVSSSLNSPPRQQIQLINGSQLDGVVRCVFCVSFGLSLFMLVLCVSNRGIRHEDAAAYKKPDSGLFRCLLSGELITFDRVNDDYCDCPDGTDETSTNACPNGVFVCSQRIR